jgi:diguanylate cyclase (GGDEF)-like protein
MDQRGSQELHARFGGDEFCFLIPDLDHFSAAWIVAERFREAVQRYDWTTEDPRLVEKPVNVDVGIVCMLLGPVGERRPFARALAHDLLERADKLIYEAKNEGASQIHPIRVQVKQGVLVELSADEHPE